MAKYMFDHSSTSVGEIPAVDKIPIKFEASTDEEALGVIEDKGTGELYKKVSLVEIKKQNRLHEK